METIKHQVNVSGEGPLHARVIRGFAVFPAVSPLWCSHSLDLASVFARNLWRVPRSPIVTGRPFMISKKHHEVGARVLLEQRVDPRQLLQCLRHRRFDRRLMGSRFPCCLTDVLRRANARPLRSLHGIHVACGSRSTGCPTRDSVPGQSSREGRVRRRGFGPHGA